MKKTFTLCITLFAACTLSAQWSPVYSDSSKVYYDIDFPTAQDGFVLGENTTTGSRFVMKTADGGLTWTEVALPTGFYNQLAMYSATSGYVSTGGLNARLLRTDDAFATTTSHLLDASFITMGLQLINDSSGFYMNNGSRFRSFTNYGSSITILMDTLTGTDVFSVADPSTIYVGNGPHVLKSTDAGTTWFCVNSTLSMDIGNGMAFVNADTGYYLGSTQNIWKTTDGGVTFQVADPYFGNFLAAYGPYCASVFGLGTIRWSSDYGQSFTLESLGMSNSSGVFLTPAGDCFVTNNMSGEIRKRQLPLSVNTTASATFDVKVFPNPATDALMVSIANGTNNANARFVLVNVFGEVVAETTLSNDGHVPLTGLAAGMYSYQLWSKDELLGTGMIAKQ